MKTGEIWQNNDVLILLGEKRPKDMWLVAPFGEGIDNLKKQLSHIKSSKNWCYNEISGNEIRKNFHKVYEDEL